MPTSDCILIRIKRPEDYEDVHPELVVEDFLSTPRNPVWEMEIVGPAAPPGVPGTHDEQGERHGNET